MPDASEIGTDYTINSSVVTEYADSEPNGDLEECGVTEPPTLEGIEVSYTVGLDYDNAVSFVVNRGAAADVQSYLDVFRALPGCDPEVIGFYDATIDITAETIAVDGADDALVLRFSGTSDEVDLDRHLRRRPLRRIAVRHDDRKLRGRQFDRSTVGRTDARHHRTSGRPLMSSRRSRIARALLGAAVFATACSAGPSEVVVAGTSSEPPAANEAPLPAAEALPSPSIADDPPDDPRPVNLLTDADVPGWKMSAPEQAVGGDAANTTDCPLLDSFFVVLAAPGEQARGANGSITALTNAVAVLDSSTTASAFMDDVDTVWEPCVILTTLDGVQQWLEPLELPAVDGWRSVGLAFGDDDGLAFYGFWQRDTTIVSVVLDGGFDLYQISEPVFAAMADVLSGRRSPNQPVTPTEIATPEPTVEPPAPEEWTDHPLAPLVLEAAEIGEQWELTRVNILEPWLDEGQPVGRVCGVEEPDTPDGLEPRYAPTEGGDADLDVIVARGLRPAQAFLTVVRAAAGCPVEETGAPAVFAQVERPVDGADDAVCLEAFDPEPEADEASIGVLCAAIYDDLLVGIYWVASQDALDTPTVDRVVELIERVAARR